MALTITSGPAVEPVSRTEAKAHLRVTTTAEDTLIDSLIKAARQYVEEWLGRALITRTYSYHIAAAYSVELPFPPYIANSLTITAIDSEGATTAVSSADYDLDTTGVKLLIEIDELPDDTEYLTIAYQAGYGSAGSSVPEPIRQAMLLLIGQWYGNREGMNNTGAVPQELPNAVKALLSMYCVNWGL